MGENTMARPESCPFLMPWGTAGLRGSSPNGNIGVLRGDIAQDGQMVLVDTDEVVA
jgi:hypothetical protein